MPLSASSVALLCHSRTAFSSPLCFLLLPVYSLQLLFRRECARLPVFERSLKRVHAPLLRPSRCSFVAELIRVWYDNAALDTYKGAPDLRHVIVCGDTNVSRLRALAAQVRALLSPCARSIT
jgi:hypothetical protein